MGEPSSHSWDSAELRRRTLFYPRDYGKQKRECLEVWKEERGGREATYRALISAAEEAKDQLLADKIRDMIEKM